MGILHWKVLEEPRMIRIAIVVCCAALAAAEAEADPAVVYRSFAPSSLQTYHYPTAMSPYGDPRVQTQMTTSYSGYPTYQAGYSGLATVGSHKPYGYAASGRYLADSVGALHMAKREAEAEGQVKKPEGQVVEPALFYHSYGPQALYNPAYHTAYNSFPSVYSRSYYQPSYNNFGYKSFYGKREAEAEADVVYRREPLVTAYKTYTAGYPALRSYAPSVASYTGQSVRPSTPPGTSSSRLTLEDILSTKYSVCP